MRHPNQTLLRRLILLVALVATGCSTTPQIRPRVPRGGPLASTALFEAATVIQDEWQHLQFRGATEYRLSIEDAQLAVCAIGHESASGLIRRVEFDHSRCGVMEWAWRIDTLQADADIREKEREDVAASLFLLFGDPGFIVDPDPVPTLRYVWTNEWVPVETVVANPYLPETVRNIVVESGPSKVGQWVIERRNVREDFEKAFGYQPQEAVQAFALFTDNDQTKQTVRACYGWARAVCPP